LVSKKELKVTDIGYARVSSTDQDFNGQIDRLKAAGCQRIFAEKASGKSTNGRHELNKAVRALQPGDTLVTVRVDRLARSIRDLLQLLERKLIRQRCEEGIKRAKAKGTKFGRQSVLDYSQRKKIAERYASGETITALALEYDCGVATIWRALQA
jgi:DNA invertase Pin-like site-specific DNA recombinase